MQTLYGPNTLTSNIDCGSCGLILGAIFKEVAHEHMHDANANEDATGTILKVYSSGDRDRAASSNLLIHVGALRAGTMTSCAQGQMRNGPEASTYLSTLFCGRARTQYRRAETKELCFFQLCITVRANQ